MSTQNIINPNESEEKKEPLSEEKCCVNCKTTKTPLWRSGPAGPKSLCNACGIKQRKKSESKHLVTASRKVENNNNNKKRRKCVKEENNSSSSMRKEEKREICVGNGEEGKKLCGDLRRNVMALGKKVVFLQRQRSPMRRQRQRQISSSTYEKMGEVEQAAMLLIAMSCGSVFA